MTALADTDWREHAARHFEPSPRRWANPAALARALDGKTGDSLPLQVIDRELVRLTDHEVPAEGLMVFMPPQEGKSVKCSRWFPLWLLAGNPTLRIAIVSYEQEMAVRWGRQLLRDIRHADRRLLDLTVVPDSSAAGRWDTPEGGGIYCVGIGGALTGRPVDVLIIDDPVKGREEAESQTYRDRAWDWWESTALTRLAPGGICVLIQTRWHDDDLSGRILTRPSPLRWRVLSMPALAEADDPLGREPGEEFPSVRARAAGYFRGLQATMSAYVFAGIYQQNPVAVAGNFFRRAAFRYWRTVVGMPDPTRALTSGLPGGAWIEMEGLRLDLADPGVWRFATCDLAASTATGADWTVISVWAMSREADLILLDRARARVEMGDHFAMVRPLRDRWRFDLLFVPREWWGKTLILDARAAGVPVAEVVTDADKITRAIPAAGRLHAGKVWWPGPDVAPWLPEWENELAAFDKGTHDDQVDTFSAAARVAAAHWIPPAPPARARPEQAPDLARIQAAFDAATGNGHGGPPDIMTMPLG